MDGPAARNGVGVWSVVRDDDHAPVLGKGAEKTFGSARSHLGLPEGRQRFAGRQKETV